MWTRTIAFLNSMHFYHSFFPKIQYKSRIIHQTFFPPSFMFAHWNLCTWSICCEFTSHPRNILLFSLLQRIKIASNEWATVSNRKSSQIKAFKQLFFMIGLLLWLLQRKREGRGKSGWDSFITIRTAKTILDLRALQGISAN